MVKWLYNQRFFKVTTHILWTDNKLHIANNDFKCDERKISFLSYLKSLGNRKKKSSEIKWNWKSS